MGKSTEIIAGGSQGRIRKALLKGLGAGLDFCKFVLVFAVVLLVLAVSLTARFLRTIFIATYPR